MPLTRIDDPPDRTTSLPTDRCRSKLSPPRRRPEEETGPMRQDARRDGAIVTDRLVLRPMLPADASALHALLDGHPDVWRHEPGRPLPYEERLAWVETGRSPRRARAGCSAALWRCGTEARC
jgi:hypothetical protein